MRRIADVRAFEVLDSRGRPTVACIVTLDGGGTGMASVPAGASTGRHEACDLRDGDRRRYGGRGVLTAVANANGELADAVRGLDAGDQASVDEALAARDGSERFLRLGGNAALAISLATARAAATVRGLELWQHLAVAGDEPSLPLPMVNVLSGGAHAERALEIQDVLVIPRGAKTFAGAIEVAASVREATTDVAREQGRIVRQADEGGIGTPCASVDEALELVLAGIDRCGYVPGADVALAIDVAATQLFEGGAYRLGHARDAASMVDEITRLAHSYPLISIEDPLAEDDWDGWSALAPRLPTGVQLVGDDLCVTDAGRVAEAARRGAANTLLCKVNQAGTLTAARAAVDEARRHGWRVIVSARSGETEDPFIADLAVGWGAGQIKVGSTRTSERAAKWNRLLAIETTARLPLADAVG